MNVETMPLGMIQANCYILSSDAKNAAVIDPGGEVQKIKSYLEQNGLTLKMILLTHGHHDHVAAVWDLAQWAKVPVYIQEEDGEMLEDIKISLCSMVPLYFTYNPEMPIRLLKDGEHLSLDELDIKLIHTPGHSKGSSCYLTENLLFTGDTLFAGSVGRTDLYGGSYPILKKSLEILKTLPEACRVYPGHGEDTTLGFEKKTNPYLGQVDYDDYF